MSRPSAGRQRGLEVRTNLMEPQADLSFLIRPNFRVFYHLPETGWPHRRQVWTISSGILSC